MELLATPPSYVTLNQQTTPLLNKRLSMASDGSRSSNQLSFRHSFTALLSLTAENDLEVDDDLSKSQKYLASLKARISAQSKKNFLLEKDVRYIDSRIGLLIQNRMGLQEQTDMASHLDGDPEITLDKTLDDRRRNLYSNLFFLLQTEPKYIAHLCRFVNLFEIDALLQTVMFTIYGNQYESREEHLLLSMFKIVLSAQFDSISEFTSLLRANTPVSRMMTTYTRRGPGQLFLKNALSKEINALIAQKDLNLEINPPKVYEEIVRRTEKEYGQLPDWFPRSVSAEAAAANKDVQAAIQFRMRKLIELATSLLNVILDSAEQVPYGIRWICKQIKNLTKRKYSEATDYAITSLIGGFFFLRYINPAIVNCQAYMLVDSTPAESPRRTLTLIAKMLQNLANKPTYSKEPYMASLSSFVDNNRQRMGLFLKQLCDVGDFDGSLEMDQYMALSKQNLKLDISLNEIYTMHGLLLQHLDVLAPESDSRLRLCLKDLQRAPQLLPRSENYTIELQLFSLWETSIPEMDDLDLSREEILFLKAKPLFVQIIRSLPRENPALRRPLQLEKVVEAAASLRDSQMVSKGIEASELLHEISAESGYKSSFHPYENLCDEIESELQHLGSLREKIQQEVVSLETVYKSLCEFHTYLSSQLDSYKSYLANCRSVQTGDLLKSKGSPNAIGVIEVAGKSTKAPKKQFIGPFKYTHAQLEKEGIIAKSNIPLERQANLHISIFSSSPGAFVISLYYKGRTLPLLDLDVRLDDLLEMQQTNVIYLDLKYMHLCVTKTLALLNKQFTRRK